MVGIMIASPLINLVLTELECDPEDGGCNTDMPNWAVLALSVGSILWFSYFALVFYVYVNWNQQWRWQEKKNAIVESKV